MKIETHDICGITVARLDSMQHAIDAVTKLVEEKTNAMCISLNPELIVRCQTNEPLRELANNSALNICDGVGIGVASQVLGHGLLCRVAGSDLFAELLSVANKRKWRVFCYGGSSETCRRLKARIETEFADLQLVGCIDGFSYHGKDHEVASAIHVASPDLVFVALGCPRQEIWIDEHLSSLKSFKAGVGGSFDVYSGTVRRAPAFSQRMGVEWLWRLFSQPSRWRRQVALPKFVWVVIKKRFFQPR